MAFQLSTRQRRCLGAYVPCCTAARLSRAFRHSGRLNIISNIQSKIKYTPSTEYVFYYQVVASKQNKGLLWVAAKKKSIVWGERPTDRQT